MISVPQPFDLADILDGTQDFRWCLRQDGWYSGVLAGNLLHVRQVSGGLEYRAGNDPTDLLRRYFRLDDDLDAARAELAAVDAHVGELAERWPSLRVLRQPDPWECMVAYICSANNNVARIGEIVEKIAARFGQRLELDGEVRHAFPPPAAVLEAGEGELAKMRLGLDRHAKIVAAAKRICDGELDLQRLAQPQTPYIEAKRELMACRGVGPKIADCIALFALDKPEAFPMDVWIRRALGAYFPDGKVPANPSLVKWAQDRFGRNAGLASQLLFRSQRTGYTPVNKIVAVARAAGGVLMNRRVLTVVGVVGVLIALLLIIAYLLLEQRESAWEPSKADGDPLRLDVIEESPVAPVEYRDCADRAVVVTRSDVAQQFGDELDAMLMWSSNEAGCLNPGVYEEYLRKQAS